MYPNSYSPCSLVNGKSSILSIRCSTFFIKYGSVFIEMSPLVILKMKSSKNYFKVSYFLSLNFYILISR